MARMRCSEGQLGNLCPPPAEQHELRWHGDQWEQLASAELAENVARCFTRNRRLVVTAI